MFDTTACSSAQPSARAGIRARIRAHAHAYTYPCTYSPASDAFDARAVWLRPVAGAALAMALLGMGVPAGAQTAATPLNTPAPDCATTLDSLEAKIRQNYAGFLLEVRGVRKAAYDSVVRVARHTAAALPLRQCFPVLSDLVTWFNDPHLFVFQSPTVDSLTAAERQRSVRHVAIGRDEIVRDIRARGNRVDPIEGLWYDGATHYGVVPDPDGTPGKFAAVLLTADSAAWPAGAIRGWFVRQPDNSYATTLYTRGFAQLTLTGQIHRRSVLRLSPGMWGKVFPLSAADTGWLDASDVHRPRVVVRPRSVVVSVPSHDPRYTRMLDSMVRAVDSLIKQRGLLIIDVRGNEGGSSTMTRALHPYITTTEQRPTPFDSGHAVVMSSPAQIAFAKRFTGNDTSAFIRDLVARMDAHPGELVPIETTPSPTPPEPHYDGDWKVVVLTDRGTVSAAEVLVMHALRSTRAVVVGEPTAGALDYQTVQIIGLGTGDRRWALGYPTIAAHKDLPQRGMRGKGIAPHVRVDWRVIPDAIGEMERRFGRP